MENRVDEGDDVSKPLVPPDVFSDRSRRDREQNCMGGPKIYLVKGPINIKMTALP